MSFARTSRRGGLANRCLLQVFVTALLLCSLGIAQVPALPEESTAAQPMPATAATDGKPTPATAAADGKPAQTAENKSDKPTILAGWDENFFLRSADKRFSLRVTGQLQSDFRGYFNHDDLVDVTGFLVRRARFGIEATVADIYEFRLLPDFGQGQARIQDSFVNVRLRDVFQVQAGKFKQPFSYEQLIQDRFVPTMERSLIDTLVPARDIGLLVHGQKLLEDRLDYAASISNGQQNGDGDLASGIDLNFRLAVRPFPQTDDWPVLRRLQLGAAFTIGDEDELVSPSVLRTPANVTWLRFLPNILADGIRWRWSPEVAFFWRGFGVASQYFHQEQWLRAPAAADPINVRADGFYVLATWLLTGEQRTTYSTAIAPQRPFDPCHPLCSPGACEAVFRLSRLRLSDAIFLPGAARLADPVANSAGATETTLGFNWYLNKWVRVQANWEHAWFDHAVRLGPAPDHLLRIQNTLLARLQVIF